MNNQTYEQLEIPESKLENEKRFMPEGLTVNILMYKAKTFDEVLGVNLPDKVTLTVTEASMGVKVEGKTNPMKDCLLETGYTIKCPMFIESGEKIIVSTLTGEYVSREK
jgi:elongation factor P